MLPKRTKYDPCHLEKDTQRKRERHHPEDIRIVVCPSLFNIKSTIIHPVSPLPWLMGDVPCPLSESDLLWGLLRPGVKSQQHQNRQNTVTRQQVTQHHVGTLTGQGRQDRLAGQGYQALRIPRTVHACLPKVTQQGGGWSCQDLHPQMIGQCHQGLTRRMEICNQSVHQWKVNLDTALQTGGQGQKAGPDPRVRMVEGHQVCTMTHLS